MQIIAFLVTNHKTPETIRNPTCSNINMKDMKLQAKSFKILNKRNLKVNYNLHRVMENSLTM